MTWKELVSRWQSESPAIFMKIRNFGIKLGTVGLTMLTPAAIPGVDNIILTKWIPTFGSYFIVAGVCIAIISKLTCQDPTKLDTTDK